MESVAEVNVTLLGEQQELIIETVNALWLVLGSIFVVFMQAGFAFLEAGSVRAKNTKNILLKNVVDTSIGALIWYACGYAFAYGNGNVFIGGQGFFLADFTVPSLQHAFWLYSMSFAATSATIVSGALAERCRFEAYGVYTMIITGFIYPTAVHWVNSGSGWLSSNNSSRVFSDTNGLLDFAGSGTVHLLGGMCALVGAMWVGPRKGRFNTDGTVNAMPGHSTVMAAMGTMILWTGWYAFNSVSTVDAVGKMEVASLTVVNTAITASVSGVTALVIFYVMNGAVDVTPTLNGILGGLAASSSTSSYIHPYAALVVGLVAGCAYTGFSRLMVKLRVDDPLDAVAVHFANGVVGVLLAGLFATPNALEAAGYPTSATACGAFYGCGGKQFGIQVLGCVVLSTWAFTTSTIIFGLMSKFDFLRVSTSQEMEGLDVTFHGGNAYHFGTGVGMNASVMASVRGGATTHDMARRTGNGGASVMGGSLYAGMSTGGLPVAQKQKVEAQPANSGNRMAHSRLSSRDNTGHGAEDYIKMEAGDTEPLTSEGCQTTGGGGVAQSGSSLTGSAAGLKPVRQPVTRARTSQN